MSVAFELGKSGRWIGDGNPCFIVAEIGQNHQGDVCIAKRMISQAKECGADCVKFQKSDLKSKFTKAALSVPYSGVNSWGVTYGDHKQHLEFSNDEYYLLRDYAKDNGIMFSASGMDKVSADFLLDDLDVPFIKIGSSDTNNLPLLMHTAKKGKPMIISSGMQTLETMKEVYSMLLTTNPKFCFLQCTSSYPTASTDARIRVIKTFQKAFPKIPIGYSGHESGICISLAAVALGAKVLERHFTLDKTQKGTDHKASIDPSELKTLVCEIRIIEEALVGETKEFLPCEIPCFTKLGKSVVAATDIKEGDCVTEEMLCIKVSKPIGWKPESYKDLIGMIAVKDIMSDEPITENDVEVNSHITNVESI